MTEEPSEKTQPAESDTSSNEQEENSSLSESNAQEKAAASKQEELVSDDSENYKEKYFRSLATMENMRKRLLREQQDAVRLGTQKVILEMLLPIDRLEEALTFSANASAEVQNWVLGFKMILQQFLDSLSTLGVQSFSGEGQIFDPMKHDPIEGIETEKEVPGKILKVFAKGYTINGRVLRPSKVAVAQKIKIADAQSINSENSVPKKDLKEIDTPEEENER